MKKLMSFFCCCFLMLSLQHTLTAQIFVSNNTACPLYVTVGEISSPCVACNSTTPILLPAGGGITLIANHNAICGPELWRGVMFSPSSSFSFGVGYVSNPALPGAPYTCAVGPNVTGACGLTPINGTFVTTGGFGPQLITIQ